MELVGAYLKELRTIRGLTQDDVAAAARVSDRQILDWEKGAANPGVEKFRLALAYLGGSWDDVEILLRDTRLTVRHAAQLAQRRLEGLGGLSPEQRAYLETLSPEALEDLLAVARRMQR